MKPFENLPLFPDGDTQVGMAQGGGVGREQAGKTDRRRGDPCDPAHCRPI